MSGVDSLATVVLDTLDVSRIAKVMACDRRSCGIPWVSAILSWWWFVVAQRGWLTPVVSTVARLFCALIDIDVQSYSNDVGL